MEQPEVDSHKLMYHPDRVAEWKEKGDCYPVYVEIGPTNYCNNDCVFCALDFLKNGTHMIDTDVMTSALKEMAECGVKSVMFAGEGEPLMHKDIGLFTQKAKEYDLDVSITTNGSVFTTKKIEQCLPNLSWIRFSVDSGSAENYARVHGTKPENFERVMDNIRETVMYRNKNGLKTTIGAQFLVIHQNMDQPAILAGRLKDMGVDNLQIKPYSHHPNSVNNLAIDREQYNALERTLERYNSDGFKILFRKATAERLDLERDYHECYGLSFFTLIEAKGNIIPCNLFHDNSEFTYGNLYEHSFKEIWNGEKRKEILKKLRKQGVGECRKGCRLDASNRYLERVTNSHPHDNFL
ncbi:MAG: radical SAM protein [Candidatus Pacearchaeota archaeon]|nr:radical SAM protein [Candidatus Pacearchaeota archaeon]